MTYVTTLYILNRNGFFYLTHTFRKNNKVIHREKYLGKEIPKDIQDLRELFLRKCLKEGVFNKLKLIQNNFRKEWKNYPKSIKKKILINFAVNFTYNTNAIEGSTITLEETEDIIKRQIAPNKPIKDVQETINHSKLFLEILNEKRELSSNLLLEWHNKLFEQTKPDIAGKFREYLVRVGDYLAPDWQDINKLIKEFISWYLNNKNLNPIEVAARAHYKFEKIHPFVDGNGRIGRLIIAYTLRKSGFPLLTIDYKKRKNYYTALKKTEDDFLNYFIRRYISFNKKYIK